MTIKQLLQRNSLVGLIGYVPQSIYVRDDTIKNIAFGKDKDEIDQKLIEKAVEICQT